MPAISPRSRRRAACANTKSSTSATSKSGAMHKLSEALYLVAITLWVGGLWVIGYLAAPLLFASLGDRQLAGVVAGKLFALIGWIGLGSAAYLLVFLFVRHGAGALKRLSVWLILPMALMTAASLFGIQPLMVQLKLDA